MALGKVGGNQLETTLNIDSGTLYVDGTNNRVGVATASPAQPLHVVGGAVQFQNTQSTYLQVNTTDTHLYTAGAHPLRFGTNSTERMKIDSLGRVTIPGQPAFRAFGNTQGAVNSGEFTGYTTTNFNTGGHFSTSTGRFTAPVAGVYFFRADFRSSQSQGSGNMYIDIMVNSSNTVCRHEEVGSSFNAFHQTLAGVYYMNVGDYASIVVGGGGSNFQPDNSPTDSFAGFLVG